MRLIGLGHRKRVGKNELAKMIAQETGGRCGGFADNLKAAAKLAFGWAGLQDGEYYETHAFAKEEVIPVVNFSPREIYIRLGQAVRAIHPDAWMRGAIENFDIIYDVRFPNEADAILAAGGILVRVDRDTGAPTDGSDDALAKYPRWTHIVNNNGSLDDLRVAAKFLAGEVMK